MALKTLNLAADLREIIEYDARNLPLVKCIDHFNDYADMEWSCHWHDEFEFLMVKSGTVRCTIYEGLGNPAAMQLAPGDVLFINSGILHSVKALEPDTVTFGFVLPLSFFDALPPQGIGAKILRPVAESGFPCITAMSGDGNHRGIIAAIDDLYLLLTDRPCYELLCIEILCRIWRLLTESVLRAKQDVLAAEPDPAAAQVKQMIAYIHEHFHESITAADLARHAGISRTECFKCFRRVLNKTPIGYLNEYRLSTAAMLLGCSGRSITEIALSCGFADASYFSKLFRNQYGITPRQYRLANR